MTADGAIAGIPAAIVFIVLAVAVFGYTFIMAMAIHLIEDKLIPWIRYRLATRQYRRLHRRHHRLHARYRREVLARYRREVLGATERKLPPK